MPRPFYMLCCVVKCYIPVYYKRMKPPYDHTNPESIEQYAKLLVGKTLRQVVPENDLKEYLNNSRNKGEFGVMVEKLYFGITPGSFQGPDFHQAGVELKTNPLKKNQRNPRVGIYSAKERLSLTMIDFNALYDVNLKEESKFYGKNGLILLLSFVEGDSKEVEDRVFKFAKLIRFDDFREDYKGEICNDWKLIVDKVNSGKGPELSEADTMFLAACRKGNKGDTIPRRAFAYKQTFMNVIYDLYLNNIEPTPPIVKNIKAIGEKGFQVLFKDIFSPYFSLDEEVICDKLNRNFPAGSKSRLYWITKSIAGADIDENPQLEYRNIKAKTLRLDWDGEALESWSFPHFTYMGEGNITKEIWHADDEDEAYPEIKRLLTETQFAIPIWRQKEGLGRKGKLLGLERYWLEDIVFWRMPEHDIEKYVRPVWERTKWVIKNGEVNSEGFFEFTDSTFNSVCHIRPHGRNNKDLLPTLKNGNQRKNCFWLDKKYLMQQILP